MRSISQKIAVLLLCFYMLYKCEFKLTSIRIVIFYSLHMHIYNNEAQSAEKHLNTYKVLKRYLQIVYSI